MARRRGGRGDGRGEAARPGHAAITRALAEGDIAGAARMAETALAAGAADPMLLNLAAWAREEAGDFAGAHALLKRALALAPGDVMVLGGIGAVLRKEGRYEEALAVLDRVVSAEPRHAPAWLERGYTLDALRHEAPAAESYARAITIDPALAPAHGKLADGAARRGERSVAEAHAARALAIDPREPAATAALATLAIEARDGAAAEARLTHLLAGPLGADDRTRALTLLGDALDRQDRTAEAFARWGEAQACFAAAHAAMVGPTPGRPSHRDFIEAITAQVAAAPAMPPAPPAPPGAGAAATHVFLLGYPRSGTTLVENVLASAPGVTALEERDTLADADAALLANDGAMPPLDALDPGLLARLRAGYWRRVTAMAGDVAGRAFVDMNPFNGIKLPMIARLFPQARIVVMRRDPRDVVLSCYRINFTPSPAAYAFSDLAETARHYDAQMRLTALCMERLPLAFHELRYDRLVADFTPTVRALADFTGLEWTDAFHAFDRTAQARGVRTASATQVRRGLYDGGGQWRRYAGELAPVLPILAPWVERLGFTP
ncbi:MAG: sulfotransferase [Sphingomonas sp.]